MREVKKKSWEIKGGEKGGDVRVKEERESERKGKYLRIE